MKGLVQQNAIVKAGLCSVNVKINLTRLEFLLKFIFWIIFV